jgi:hypothetical protein
LDLYKNLFAFQAYYVQSARPKAYDALIVYNYKGQGPIPMSGGKYKDAIEIPVVMISYQCMEEILSHFTSQKGYSVSTHTLTF